MKKLLFFRHLETQVLCLLITTVFVACRPPTGQPGIVISSTPTVTVTSSSVVSMTTSSPITVSPIVTPDPAATDSVSPLPATATFVVATEATEPMQVIPSTPSPSSIPIITLEARTTEPSPQPIETSMAAQSSIESYDEAMQEGSVTVGGYTFSLPQKVKVTGLGRLLDIEGWLPHNLNEIIGFSDDKVVGIDVYNGQTRFFSHESARGIKPDSIILLKDDRVAFLTFNTKARQATDLWISGADKDQALAPTFAEAGYDKVTTLKGQDLVLYSQETSKIKVLGQDGAIQKTSIATQPLEWLHQRERQTEEPTEYRITPSPDGQWLMFDRGASLYLANQKTDGIKQIDLDKRLRVMALRWSPDSGRVGLLITAGPAPIPYTKLFILEVENEKLREVTTQFQYITNITWAPDNQKLLISVDTGTALTAEGFEYSTGELFLVDAISGEIQLVPILPPNSRIDFVKKLSWASDGQKIVLSGFIPNNTSLLHRINITQP